MPGPWAVAKLAKAAPEGFKMLTARRLDPKGASNYFLLLPIMGWGAVNLAALAVSYSLLWQSSDYIQDVGAVGLASCAGTRIRIEALTMLMAASGQFGPDVAAPVANSSAGLAAAAADLLVTLDAVLLGGNATLGSAGSLKRSTAHESLMFLPQASAAPYPRPPHATLAGVAMTP